MFPPPEGFPYGAAHASEIQYLFTLRTEVFPATLSPARQQLAAAMRGYWTDLATFAPRPAAAAVLGVQAGVAEPGTATAAERDQFLG